MIWLAALLVSSAAWGAALDTVRLRADGNAVATKDPVLADAKEVYISLNTARALKCVVAVRPREDSAEVTGPAGARKEIALTRLRGILMIPLTSLADLLDMDVALKNRVCDLRSRRAPPKRAAQGVGGGNPGAVQRAADLEADQPGVPATVKEDSHRQGPAASTGKPSTAAGTTPQVAPWRKVAGETGTDAEKGPVQKPDVLEADPVKAVDGTDAPGDPPSSRSLPARGSVGPTVPAAPVRIRDVICEAVDPAQAKLIILADGKISPKVAMQKDLSEVAIDIPGAVLDTPGAEWTFGHPVVSSVRPASAATPGVVRLMVKLTRLVTYRARPLPPDGYEVAFRLPRLIGRRLNEVRVVLDPGHGGPSATGCSAMHKGVRVHEKTLTLSIARKVYDKLTSMGVNVTLTRTKDAAVKLSARPELANNTLADLFVSIHVDAAPSNPSASGTTAYYHGADESGRALAFALAQTVSAAGRLPNRGARSDWERFEKGMAVLRPAEMPATLLEVAFITNAGDRAKLVTDEFQATVADAVARGIRTYIEATLPMPPQNAGER